MKKRAALFAAAILQRQVRSQLMAAGIKMERDTGIRTGMEAIHPPE